MRRHDHFHKVFGVAVSAFAFDQNFFDIAVIQIADRPFDQIAFFVNLRGRDRLKRQLAHLFPQTLKVFVIPFNFGFGPLCTCGSNDKARPLRDFHFVCDFFEVLAVGCICNFTADTTATRSILHQNAIAARKAEGCCQRSAFVATFFFDHLYQQNLANFDDFLNFVATRPWLARHTDFIAVIFICNRLYGVVFFRCGTSSSLFVFVS